MTIYLSLDKKESSPTHRLSINNQTKRKSTELTSYSGISIIKYDLNKQILFYLDDKTFISNGKTARLNLNENSVYDTSIYFERNLFEKKSILCLFRIFITTIEIHCKWKW
jgi:hypothetical protein